MTVILFGLLAIFIPIWIFLVIGKFIAQYTNSDFMSEWSWWVMFAPIWIPAIIFTLISLGLGFLFVIFRFVFGFI